VLTVLVLTVLVLTVLVLRVLVLRDYSTASAPGTCSTSTRSTLAPEAPHP
jgi:hypothetical protein